MSGSAYTPGLSVTAWTQIEKIRELPLPGKVLVKPGEKVKASLPVLSAELPGELEIIRLSDRLNVPVEEALQYLKVKVGDSIEKKQLLAEIETFFGWFSSSVESPCNGTVEFITEAVAHLGIRRPSSQITVRAYLDGEVLAVEEGKSVTIAGRGAQIQGIFGVGGERYGDVCFLPVSPDEIVTSETLVPHTDSLPGAIIIGGAGFHRDALRFAAKEGAVAVITGSIDSATLSDYVGHEIGVSITGDEDVPLTLIVTEGFGKLSLSPRIVDLAKRLHGKSGSVSGATQVRAGAVRPELFVSLDGEAGVQTEGEASTPDGRLELGSRIRIIRVPYFGQFGTVTALPHEPEAVPCGSVVRVLKAKLESGDEITLSRANVELC